MEKTLNENYIKLNLNIDNKIKSLNIDMCIQRKQNENILLNKSWINLKNEFSFFLLNTEENFNKLKRRKWLERKTWVHMWIFTLTVLSQNMFAKCTGILQLS